MGFHLSNSSSSAVS